MIASDTHTPPVMVLELEGIPVDVVEAYRRKQAKGVYREGRITVTVPSNWPLDLKASSCLNLARRILKKHKKETALLKNLPENTEKITIYNNNELNHYVNHVNSSSLKASIKESRIGQAKFSRLAQINLKNNVITVSKYCLYNVPEPALRYLILHELCHTKQANHSPRFWALVQQFMPNYAYWSDVMAACHQYNISTENKLERTTKNETN